MIKSNIMKLSMLLFVTIIGMGFNRIESSHFGFEILNIEMGGVYSLKLTQEGLICKGMDKKGRFKIQFFEIKDLNMNLIEELNKNVDNTITLNLPNTVDDKSIVSSAIPIKLTIVKDDHYQSFLWIDGKNEQLENLITSINLIVPKKYQTTFVIKSPN